MKYCGGGHWLIDKMVRFGEFYEYGEDGEFQTKHGINEKNLGCYT